MKRHHHHHNHHNDKKNREHDNNVKQNSEVKSKSDQKDKEYKPNAFAQNNKKIINKLFNKVKSLGFLVKIKRAFNRGNNGSVFIIKQDGIGDFVLFQNAFKRIREFYKGKKIIACVSSLVYQLAVDSNLFDEVICFSKEDFTHLTISKSYKILSKYKVDVLLHPTQPRAIHSEIIAHLVNAKVKIASRGEAGALPQALKDKFDSIYDTLIDTGNENHTLIQTANFMRGIGDTEYKAILPKLTATTPFNMFLPEKYFVVFLGGSIYNKLWPADRFYAVSKYVQEKTGYEIVVCGLSADKDQEQLFESQGDLKYYSLLGKTTLNELITVISKAQLVLSNDTCAVHFANALGVKSVCVKGQFSGAKFFPYVVEEECEGDIYPSYVQAEVGCKGCTLRGRSYHCIGGDYYARRTVKCLMAVTPEKVIQKIDEILS